MGKYKKHSLYSGLVLTVIALATGMALHGNGAKADTTTVANQPDQSSVHANVAGQQNVRADQPLTGESGELDNQKTSASNFAPLVLATQNANNVTPQSQVTSGGANAATTNVNNGYTWQQQNGNYYWQNAQGQNLTGWQQINGSWYYLGNSGAATVNSWYQTQAQNWYYFDQNGVAQTGWQNINGSKYYFNPTGAWAEKGWQWLSNEAGQSNWYYFDPVNAYAFRDQWYHDNSGHWYYLNDQGQSLTGLQNVNGSVYRFDPVKTWANTGWQFDNNHWYYFDPTNVWGLTNWQYLANHWYYFDNQAQALTGMHVIAGKTYRLDPTNAWANTGWQFVNSHWYYFDANKDWGIASQWMLNGNRWYYFNSDAQAETGFQTINGRNYHFDDSNAWADTNWKFLNGKWYYYDPNNAWAEANWQYLNGHWYFLKPDGQALEGRQLLNYNGQTNWYWFDENNAYLYTGLQFINGYYYAFNPDGSQLLGWQNNGTVYYDPANAGRRVAGQVTINGANYYFDPATGQKATGLVLVKFKNQLYLYDANGRQVTSATGYQFNPDGSVIVANNGGQLIKLGGRYFDYQQGRFKTGWDFINGTWYNFNGLGYATTGWAKISNHWYYFDPASAQALTGWFRSGAGAWYYFDPTNAWAASGWQNINNRWYYFDPANAWANTGWQRINGAWYYFDQTNAWADTGWQWINGAWYYFDPTNAWADTNWQWINNNWYYFDPSSTAMVVGARWIGNTEYVFDYSDGHWISDPFSATVLKWFYNHEGQLTYSMYGSRNGDDGTADCSGSVTQALRTAGAYWGGLYNTETLHGYLTANGYHLVYENGGYTNPQAGDVVIWGKRGASAGAGGHTGVVSGSGSNAYFISTSYYTEGQYGTAVQNLPYFSYWASDGWPYYYVYRR